MVTLKRILLTLVLLLAVSSTCFASSWYWIGEDSSHSQWYIDNDSVEKDFYTALVWIKINMTDGTYTLQRGIYKHPSKEYSIQAFIEYDENGNVVDSNSRSYTSYRPIAPGTMAEIIYYSIWPN